MLKADGVRHARATAQPAGARTPQLNHALAVRVGGEDDSVSSSEPELVQVGGQVDSSCVTLGVYGENLDPEEVSKLLGCASTHSHRRGDLINGTSNPRPFGAWLLTFQVTAPQGPNELVAMLQEQLPSNLELWRSLRSSYEIRVTFGIFLDDWNRNFQFTPEELRFLSSLGAAIGFDVYSHREEGDG